MKSAAPLQLSFLYLLYQISAVRSAKEAVLHRVGLLMENFIEEQVCSFNVATLTRKFRVNFVIGPRTIG